MKFVGVLFAFILAVQGFDYAEFQRKYCYEEDVVRTTAYYFPYEIGLVKTWSNGYVCENFNLTKENLDYMASTSFSFTNSQYILMKNCEIEYFNEYLASKFQTVWGIIFENCKVSFKNPTVVANPNITKLSYLGFHNCIINDNLNSTALQKFSSLYYILIQNSTFQYPYLDEYFIPIKHNLNNLMLHNVNVKKIHKGLLSNSSRSFHRVSCTSCELEEIDSLFYGMNFDINNLFSFYDNKIKKLPTSLDIFAKTPTVPEINLSGNLIDEPLLKRIHFKSLKTLKILDLSRNTNINGISYLTFKDTYLQKLNMSKVNLEHLNKLGNANLTTIDFSNNKISNIPLDTFEDLKYLNHLNLSYNKIGNLEGSVFKDLQNLKELFLKRNKLSKLHPDLFINLINLQILDLSSNVLEVIDGFESLKNLQQLYLQKNLLKIIPSSTALPSSLRTLDISKNFLNFISRNTFDNLPELISLDISYTNNSYIACSRDILQPLKNLKVFKIKGNQMNSVNEIFLPSSLEELSLEFNNILMVMKTDIGNLTNLKYLNLSYNHLYFFDEEINDNLPKLKNLDISGNDL